MSFVIPQEMVRLEAAAGYGSELASLRACIIGPHPTAAKNKLTLVDDFALACKMLGEDEILTKGVCAALANSGCNSVAYIAVDNPDSVASWGKVIPQLRDVYGLVPLTENKEVLKLFIDHVSARKPRQDRRAVLWCSAGNTECVQEIIDAARAVAHRNVRLVWPGDMLVCAALAGLRSGVAPHQELCGVEIIGVDSVASSVWQPDDLDTLAEHGVWVLETAYDVDGQCVVTRNAVTTVGYSAGLDKYDEAVVTNLDYINKRVHAKISEVIRTVRPTTMIQQSLHGALSGVLIEISLPRVPRLGPQLLDSEIVSVAPSIALQDNIALTMKLVLPASPLGGLMPTSDITIEQKIVA